MHAFVIIHVICAGTKRQIVLRRECSSSDIHEKILPCLLPIHAADRSS